MTNANMKLNLLKTFGSANLISVVEFHSKKYNNNFKIFKCLI